MTLPHDLYAILYFSTVFHYKGVFHNDQEKSSGSVRGSLCAISWIFLARVHASCCDRKVAVI